MSRTVPARKKIILAHMAQPKRFASRTPFVFLRKFHTLEDRSTQHGIFHLHVVHGNLHASSAGLHAGHASLHSLQSLLDALEPLGDAREALGDIVAYAIELVRQAAHALCYGGVLLAGRRGGDPGLVVVSRVLDGKAPLVVQLHLADGLGTPGAIDLTRARVPLLRGAVVLDTATVTDQVVARGLAIAVVAGAELDDTVALVLRHTLHGAQQVLEASIDALGRRGEGARLARGHGSGRDGRGNGRRGGRGHLTGGAQHTGRAVGDDDARGDGRVVRILLERNLGGVDGKVGENEGMRTSLQSSAVLDDVGDVGVGRGDFWPYF
ncbi:hypothetical protein F5B18DRAFT_419374 [Nemania serpens]|nr:hypothetical protein F5B18DRAFT_419374 [Nemania serpens]